MQGKIIKGIGGFYYVHDGHGSVTECKAKGAFRNQAVKPLVGDDVSFTLLDEPGKGRIDELLPRRSELIRPAVANADTALILVTAGKPAFHPMLLDLFLLWMARQSLPTVIGIGKSDLGGDISAIRDIYERAGYTVRVFSAVSGEGLDQIRSLLRGKTTVLAGASGVGKSTLLNALIPEAAMETGTLSRKLGRGRHTTRHSELFYLEENSFLFDTPGFTSLSAPDMAPEEVKDYYPEFDNLGPCAYDDCMHLKEPGCAVKDALEAGLIAPSRYESYSRIVSDLRSRQRY